MSRPEHPHTRRKLEARLAKGIDENSECDSGQSPELAQQDILEDEDDADCIETKATSSAMSRELVKQALREKLGTVSLLTLAVGPI